MKNRLCPSRAHCWGYKNDSCDDCEPGKTLIKLHKKIDRLKKKNARLEQELAAAPAIVRCKDCVHRHPFGVKCTVHQIPTSDDHFCSDGMRPRDAK